MRALARKRIHGSPTASGVSCFLAGFHAMRWPCLLCSSRTSRTAPMTSTTRKISVKTGATTHAGPQSGGAAASRRTQVRVRPCRQERGGS